MGGIKIKYPSENLQSSINIKIDHAETANQHKQEDYEAVRDFYQQTVRDLYDDLEPFTDFHCLDIMKTISVRYFRNVIRGLYPVTDFYDNYKNMRDLTFENETFVYIQKFINDKYFSTVWD